MRDALHVPILAALLSATLPELPQFDWRQLLWTVGSAVLAIGLEWLRRWLAQPKAGVEHADPFKDPPA